MRTTPSPCQSFQRRTPPKLDCICARSASVLGRVEKQARNAPPRHENGIRHRCILLARSWSKCAFHPAETPRPCLPGDGLALAQSARYGRTTSQDHKGLIDITSPKLQPRDARFLHLSAAEEEYNQSRPVPTRDGTSVSPRNPPGRGDKGQTRGVMRQAASNARARPNDRRVKAPLLQRVQPANVRFSGSSPVCEQGGGSLGGDPLWGAMQGGGGQVSAAYSNVLRNTGAGLRL